MNLNLKYGDIYNLIIEGEEYKGIYLGHTVPRKKLRFNYIMLVNKEMGDLVKFPYSLVRFKSYRFNKKNKLILQKMKEVIPAYHEREYLEDLCEKFG